LRDFELKDNTFISVGGFEGTSKRSIIIVI